MRPAVRMRCPRRCTDGPRRPGVRGKLEAMHCTGETDDVVGRSLTPVCPEQDVSKVQLHCIILLVDWDHQLKLRDGGHGVSIYFYLRRRTPEDHIQSKQDTRANVKTEPGKASNVPDNKSIRPPDAKEKKLPGGVSWSSLRRVRFPRETRPLIVISAQLEGGRGIVL